MAEINEATLELVSSSTPENDVLLLEDELPTEHSPTPHVEAEQSTLCSNSHRKKNTGDKMRKFPLSPLGATPRSPLPQPYVSRDLQAVDINNESYAKKIKKWCFGKRQKNTNRFLPSEEVNGGPTVFTVLKKKKYPSPRIWPSVVKMSLIMTGSFLCLLMAFSKFPRPLKQELQYIKVPKTMEDLKNFGTSVIHYKDRHFNLFYVGFCLIYIFLQTFAIPGGIILSILSGFLFSFPLALVTVCLCTALGASFCYLLSSLTKYYLVFNFLSSYVDQLSTKAHDYENNLLNYIIFLRVSPFLPNWFINIMSPVIRVSFASIFFGTLLGIIPASCFAIHCGTALHDLTFKSFVSRKSLMILITLGVISFLPIILHLKKNKSKVKKE